MTKQTSTAAKAGIGAGLAALAAATAAGAYYFYGSKDANKHRKQMKGWAIKARGEVVERLENMKNMTEESYDKAVGQVMDKYKKVKSINPAEVAALAQDLRRHWKNISSQFKSPRPASKSKKTKAKK
jgi:hypothetical protein